MPKPFYYIPPSLQGPDIDNILAIIQENEHLKWDFTYDQYGYKTLAIEEPELVITEKEIKLEKDWIKFLEYSQSTNPIAPFSWEYIKPYFLRTDQSWEKIASLVQAGVPDALRRHIWVRLTPALKNWQKHPEIGAFNKTVVGDTNYFFRILEKDSNGVMPNNACFGAQATGMAQLKRVLRAFLAHHYPARIFYAPSLCLIASYLVLIVGDEALCFWLLRYVAETLLGVYYFCPYNYCCRNNERHFGYGVEKTLPLPPGLKVRFLPLFCDVIVDLLSEKLLKLGLYYADVDVVLQLIKLHAPDLHSFLALKALDIQKVVSSWLSTIFAGHFGNLRALLRIWDLVFLQGISVIFKLIVAILVKQYEALKNSTSTDEMLELVQHYPPTIHTQAHIDLLLADSKLASIDQPLVLTLRQRFLQDRLLEMGHFEGVSVKNPFKCLESGPNENEGGKKYFWNTLRPNRCEKSHSNIMQSEKLVCLRESVLQIAAHFMACNCPSHSDGDKINNVSKASPETISQECSAQNGGKSVRTAKRAKALYDFEGHDSDELIFHRNDIITVVSQKDQHCWLGEINGVKGWFPSKFVQLLDERMQKYCPAGDDAVNEIITHLVRGPLCYSLKGIFMHGFLEQSSLFANPRHPWQFIREVAGKCTQAGNKPIRSRLYLCRAFSLDEDTNILTPRELFLRYIQSINESHDNQKLSMDAKFRSLVCAGLNQHLLHAWFECIINSESLLSKWYTPTAFLRTPVTNLIKVELHALANYSFNLNVDWEVPVESCDNLNTSKLDMIFSNESQKALTRKNFENITKFANTSASSKQSDLKASSFEITIKHNLFSWDL